MSATARLVWTVFTATPLCRGLFALGLALMLAGLTGYLHYPTWSLGTGMRSSPLWYQSVVLLAPWLGLMLLFFASSTLPAVVERLLLGRAIYVLPLARLSLLLGALATANLIALLTAAAGVLVFLYYPAELVPERIFLRTWLITFSNVGLMYAALWIVSKTRGVWLLIGSLLIVVGIVVPLAAIGQPSGVPLLTWAGLAIWAAFATLLALGSRLRHAANGRAARVLRATGDRLPNLRYSPGAELDLLLGTTRPWTVAVGQAVPVVVAAWLLPETSAWLFALTLFTAISGAITSTAAARSRVLWLKLGWTRDELFRRVEAAYWHYNAYPLGVLLLLFVGIGSYLDMATPLLALGLLLLVLGSVVSAYLGLMMTRGLRALEIALGIGTMALLLAAALAAATAESRMPLAIGLELALAGLAVAYRAGAKARWHRLDWLVCRDAAAARGAG